MFLKCGKIFLHSDWLINDTLAPQITVTGVTSLFVTRFPVVTLFCTTGYLGGKWKMDFLMHTDLSEFSFLTNDNFLMIMWRKNWDNQNCAWNWSIILQSKIRAFYDDIRGCITTPEYREYCCSTCLNILTMEFQCTARRTQGGGFIINKRAWFKIGSWLIRKGSWG